MCGELVLLALETIVRHTRCFKEDPIPLILDNGKSHVSIIKAKDSSVILVAFPPHCSHHVLEKLDSTHSRSLKDAKCDSFISMNNLPLSTEAHT